MLSKMTKDVKTIDSAATPYMLKNRYYYRY